MTETYIELHARSAFSFSGRRFPARRSGRRRPRTSAIRPWRCSIATASTARRAFTWRRRKPASARTSAPRSPARTAFQYPLLVENRTGYQNLCRLITRMKLRAKKGEGAATPEELAEFSNGLICLAPAPANTRSRRSKRLRPPATSTPKLQRHLNREEEARNQAQIDSRAPAARSAARDQRRAPCHSRAARGARRAHLRSQSRATGRPPAGCSRTMPSAI